MYERTGKVFATVLWGCLVAVLVAMTVAACITILSWAL